MAYALRTPSEHYRQTHGIKYRGDVDFKPTGPFKAPRKIEQGNTKIISSYIDEGVEFTFAHYWVHAWEKDDSYAENGSENWKKWRMVEYLTMIEGSNCLFVGAFNSQVIRDALFTIGQPEWIGLASERIGKLSRTGIFWLRWIERQCEIGESDSLPEDLI